MRRPIAGSRRLPAPSRSIRWKREILALALHYRLDQRVERLFDALSECRGGPTGSTGTRR